MGREYSGDWRILADNCGGTGRIRKSPSASPEEPIHAGRAHPGEGPGRGLAASPWRQRPPPDPAGPASVTPRGNQVPMPQGEMSQDPVYRAARLTSVHRSRRDGGQVNGTTRGQTPTHARCAAAPGQLTPSLNTSTAGRRGQMDALERDLGTDLPNARLGPESQSLLISETRKCDDGWVSDSTGGVRRMLRWDGDIPS